MGDNKRQSKSKKLRKNIKRKANISLQSQIIEKALWLSRVKQPFTTVETTMKMIEARFEKNRLKRNLPKLKSNVEIIDTYIKEVYKIGDFSNKNKVIIYLHGGAYINQPMRQHWKFVDNLTVITNIPVIFPLYPKAPEFNYLDCYDYLNKIYLDLVKEGYEEIILIGDSAGGGLALGLSQYLNRNNLKEPKDLILMSPWLDLTMSNAKIEKYEKVDPMLASVGLFEIAKVWAKNSNLTDYKLSPINGKLSSNSRLTVFVGTHEIFLPDIRLFKDKAKEENVNINYYEYKHMNHVFPLYPIPEAKKVFDQILKILV